MLLGEKPFQLLVGCRDSEYTLTLRQGEVEDRGTCAAQDLIVMPPVGGAFAGVMFGIYAFGRGEPALDPADFTGIRVVEH